MNFRITTLFFGLLLTTLFVFGLMIAQKKTAVDQTAIVPTLAEGKVEKIVIKHAGAKAKDAATLEFVTRGDHWYYKEKDQEVRVEDFRIKEMIDAVKGARPDEDVANPTDLAQFGLQPPQLTVVLTGKIKDDPKEWTFFVGKERPGTSMYYVNSSEKDQKAYAVPKRAIDALFVKDVATIRAKRLFGFIESGVTGLDIQKGKEKLEIKKQEGNTWVFVEPKLGYISVDSGADAPPPPEDKFHPKKAPKEEPVSPVKALLGSIIKITVDDAADFVPLGSPLSNFDLDAKTAPMRIEIRTTDDAKNPVTDTLLVGKKIVKDKETYYYARLSYDDGVFKINGKVIKSIDDVLADPGKLRSFDVAAFDPKSDKKETRVDFIHFKNAKDDVKFFFPEISQDPWEMFLYDAAKKKWEKKKANDSAVGALVEHMVGKKEIVNFLKLDDADKDKKIAEWGLKMPSAEIALYANVVERTKKEDKKDEKENKDKKDDKDKKDVLPEVKKDAKPIVKLEFGNLDKEGIYYVRRTLENGVESYFTLKKEFLDKIIPSAGVELAYLDTELPTFNRDDVLGVKLVGVGEKGKEPLELVPHMVDGKEVWYVKDPLEKPSGLKPADGKLVANLIGVLSQLHAKKWIKKLDDKEDLGQYGLKDPGVIVTVKLKKHATGAGTLLGALASDASVLAALGSIVSHYQSDKGSELVTIEFGKEAFEDKEKGKEKEKLGVYARQSKSDLLFVLPNDLVKFIKDTDLRDRASLMNVQARLIASQIGIVAGDFEGAWLLLSPYLSGEIHHLDPDKIKEVRLTIRTPVEVRSFVFERAGKDKDATWFDRTPGLVEFSLDSDKVAQLVKDFAKLRTERYVAIAGGQRGEHKLGPKDFTAKLDFTTDDGRTITVLIGSSYQNQGHYATSSYWRDSEAVFMIPDSLVAPLLRGVQHFAKERSPAN